MSLEAGAGWTSNKLCIFRASYHLILTSISLCLSFSLSLFFSLFLSFSLFFSLSLYLSISIYIYIYLFLFLSFSFSLFLSFSLYLHLDLYIYIYVCMYASISLALGRLSAHIFVKNGLVPILPKMCTQECQQCFFWLSMNLLHFSQKRPPKVLFLVIQPKMWARIFTYIYI